MHRQPWHPPSSPGAIPHAAAAEGGVHPTPKGQAPGECREAPGQVRRQPIITEVFDNPVLNPLATLNLPPRASQCV